jgi:ribosomal protein S18 acetylase RimI-like enzyme
VSITVRLAALERAEDTGAIVAILDAYARDPAGGGAPLRASVRERLPAALRDHPTAVVFLALAAPQPVGTAVCFLGFSTFQARPLLNVHDLAVLPDWRGQGVGRALLEAAETEAVRRDCCKLTLEVQEDNHRARRLYERFGFTDYLIGGAPTRFLCKSLGVRAWEMVECWPEREGARAGDRGGSPRLVRRARE